MAIVIVRDQNLKIDFGCVDTLTQYALPRSPAPLEEEHTADRPEDQYSASCFGRIFRMHSQQHKQDYESSTPAACGGLETFSLGSLSQSGGYRYNQTSASINPQETIVQTGLQSEFASFTDAIAPGAYYQGYPGYPTADVRQQIPSQPTAPAPSLTNLRSHSGAQQSPQKFLSAREQYRGDTPLFARKQEAIRNNRALPSNFSTVMSGRGSWAGTGAQLPLASTYQPAHDSREHSVSPSYTSRPANEEVVLPMCETEQLGTLQYFDADGTPTGTTIRAEISAQIHKNFFFGEKHYTCYRRNYMACICSFELSPYFPGVQIHFTPMGSGETLPIVGFAMSVSACVSKHPHQEVIILQHTPKRDKGPISQPAKQPVGPKNRRTQGTPPHMGSNLHEAAQASRPVFSDLYGTIETQSHNGAPHISSLAVEHNFDRIQFKTATANNGERRAGQQCYELVVELWGDMGSGHPDRWQKIAIQRSCEVVVRGRSPGHYQKERRKSSGSGGGGGPSPHGNYTGGGNPGVSDYSAGGMMPNGYAPQGPYDHRGGGGGVGGSSMYTSRRDMAPYSLEPKATYNDSTRFFPSSYTNPSPYVDTGFYGQAAAQATSVLPRPERMGHDRCNVSSAGSPSSLLPLPVPSMMAGSFMPSS